MLVLGCLGGREGVREGVREGRNRDGKTLD